MKLKNIYDKITILKGELDNIEEIEMLEEIKTINKYRCLIIIDLNRFIAFI